MPVIYLFNTNPILEVISKKIYNTQCIKDKPFFISDWDLELQESQKVKQLLKASFTEGEKNAYRYLPADENYNKIKEKIVLHTSSKINKEKIAICTNGTNAIFSCLTILSKTVKRFLLFSPVYFLFSDILKFYDCNLEYCSYEMLLTLQLNIIEEIVKDKDIEVIVLTDPILGIGRSIPDSVLRHISDICLKYNAWLVVDSLYGGCEWNIKHSVYTPINILKLVEINNKIICIDSLTKRLGLNGNKSALLFANEDFITTFQNFQLYSYGSFTISQLTLLDELYSKCNSEYIANTLNNLIQKSKDTYNLIKSILIGSEIKILPADAGYFACLSIPKNLIGVTDDTQAFEVLLDSCNVATLPLSLYEFSNKEKYNCRINLLLEKQTLLNHISKVRHIIQ